MVLTELLKRANDDQHDLNKQDSNEMWLLRTTSRTNNGEHDQHKNMGIGPGVRSKQANVTGHQQW